MQVSSAGCWLVMRDVHHKLPFVTAIVYVKVLTSLCLPSVLDGISTAVHTMARWLSFFFPLQSPNTNLFPATCTKTIIFLLFISIIIIFSSHQYRAVSKGVISTAATHTPRLNTLEYPTTSRTRPTKH